MTTALEKHEAALQSMLEAKLKRLMKEAFDYGFVLNIESKSLMPPRMGWTQMKGSVRLARHYQASADRMPEELAP